MTSAPIPTDKSTAPPGRTPRRRPRKRNTPDIQRTIVLVGMMGAGKSAVGRRLAGRLKLPFVDADKEIEDAAGCDIETIFSVHGEPAFRDGERRVIARLLDGSPRILATGGGAFMDPRTRAEIRAKGISIWLRADLETLQGRVNRRGNRPLLKADNPKAVLERLIAERYPVYATADIVVDSVDCPLPAMVERVVEALSQFLKSRDRPDGDVGGKDAQG
jgi:shikimate kinase